jgi:hypothetical protein
MGQGLERLGIVFYVALGDRTAHGGGLCASSGSDRAVAALSDACGFQIRVSKSAYLPGNPVDSCEFSKQHTLMRCVTP